MIILHVANLHFHQQWFDWLSHSAPPHDLLVIAGDLLDRDKELPHAHQAAWVTRWAQQHPAPVCIASGLHDLVRDSNSYVWRPAEWLQELASPHVWADGERREHHGLDILPLPPGGVTRGEPADIWVVHRGPAGPAVSRHPWGTDDGDPFLLYSVRKYHPRLLLCGHLHAPCNWIHVYEDTLYLNPGCEPEAEFPNHIVIDLEAGQLQRVSATSGGLEQPCVVPLPGSLSAHRPLLEVT